MAKKRAKKKAASKTQAAGRKKRPVRKKAKAKKRPAKKAAKKTARAAKPKRPAGTATMLPATPDAVTLPVNVSPEAGMAGGFAG